MHRAHRGAHHQLERGEPEPLGDELVLQPHHVGVAVLRKLHAQAVTRLARLAVADVVGQDDEVLLGIERLAFPEQPPAIRGAQEPNARSAGAVQDQDAVTHHAVGVLPRRAHGPVVNLHRRQAFAAAEREIARDEIAFDRRRECCGLSSRIANEDGDDGEDKKNARHEAHFIIEG